MIQEATDTCRPIEDQRADLAAKDPLGALREPVRAQGCAAVRDTNLKGISAVAAPVRGLPWTERRQRRDLAAAVGSGVA